MFTLILARFTAQGWTIVDADAFVISLAHYGKLSSDGIYWLATVEDNGDGTVTIDAERRADAMGDALATVSRTVVYGKPQSLELEVRRTVAKVAR